MHVSFTGAERDALARALDYLRPMLKAARDEGAGSWSSGRAAIGL